jgi:acyl-CoA reductase-like NAD-dependent aldehyde dehydrogenase
VKAAAGNLKKVSLELGGKSPNVVYADADIETAINGAASAIFFNHGQCCCAGSRLLIEQPIFDDVVRRRRGDRAQHEDRRRLRGTAVRWARSSPRNDSSG